MISVRPRGALSRPAYGSTVVHAAVTDAIIVGLAIHRAAGSSRSAMTTPKRSPRTGICVTLRVTRLAFVVATVGDVDADESDVHSAHRNLAALEPPVRRSADGVVSGGDVLARRQMATGDATSAVTPFAPTTVDEQSRRPPRTTVVGEIDSPDFDRMHMNSNRFLCSNLRSYLLNRSEVSGQGIGIPGHRI